MKITILKNETKALINGGIERYVSCIIIVLNSNSFKKNIIMFNEIPLALRLYYAPLRVTWIQLLVCE